MLLSSASDSTSCFLLLPLMLTTKSLNRLTVHRETTADDYLNARVTDGRETVSVTVECWNDLMVRLAEFSRRR